VVGASGFSSRVAQASTEDDVPVRVKLGGECPHVLASVGGRFWLEKTPHLSAAGQLLDSPDRYWKDGRKHQCTYCAATASDTHRQAGEVKPSANSGPRNAPKVLGPSKYRFGLHRRGELGYIGAAGPPGSWIVNRGVAQAPQFGSPLIVYSPGVSADRTLIRLPKESLDEV